MSRWEQVIDGIRRKVEGNQKAVKKIPTFLILWHRQTIYRRKCEMVAAAEAVEATAATIDDLPERLTI